MKYYKWYIFSIISLVIGLTFCYYFFIYNFSKFAEGENHWINKTWVKKVENTKRSVDNKIVFISGSNTFFGVRTKDITESIGIPTYNLAIHAGLGLDFYLEESKRLLNKGDIIILPLEYIHYRSNDQLTKLGFHYYREYDEKELHNVPFIEKAKVIFSTSPVDVLFDYVNSYLAPNANYGPINEFGDMIGNIGNKDLGSIKPIIFPREFKETLALKKIKEFNDWCNKHGIVMYITYPNTVYFKEYNNETSERYLSSLEDYFRLNNIKTIGSPFDFFYSKDLFYDTEYHLNEEGANLNTKKLIGFLKNNNDVINVFKQEKLYSKY